MIFISSASQIAKGISGETQKRNLKAILQDRTEMGLEEKTLQNDETLLWIAPLTIPQRFCHTERTQLQFLTFPENAHFSSVPKTHITPREIVSVKSSHAFFAHKAIPSDLFALQVFDCLEVAFYFIQRV